MSDQERAAFADQVASATITKAIAALTSPTVAEGVIDTWGGQVQKIVGRAVMRLALYVIFAAFAIAGFKMGMLEKFFGWLAGK